MNCIPRPKKGKYLPTVLSRKEVSDLLDALKDPKHRAVAMVMFCLRSAASGHDGRKQSDDNPGHVLSPFVDLVS